jgi:hypothetical protein
MGEYEGLAAQLEELRAASVALQTSAEAEWARAARAEAALQTAQQELDALRNQVRLFRPSLNARFFACPGVLTV